MTGDGQKGKLSTKQLKALEQLLDDIEALPPEDRYQAITDSDIEEDVRSAAISKVLGGAPTIGEEGGKSPSVTSNRRDLAGRMIGPYKVTRLIGSGGMGQVYEAVQEHPRRTVAIKLMRGSIDSEKTRARFHYEVQLLGRLQHPGIARIYDAGMWEEKDHELPYFAMEYIPNAKPIDEYINSKNLSIDERLAIFADVCDAVAYGHERGIIHRDLKPGNILVDGQGTAKIIDFGVARATDSDVTMTGARTAVGQIIGTLQYMSPEQCAADPNDIDIRSDVYSLGVVLYELISGKMPYDLEGTAIHAAIRVVQEQEPTTLSDLAKTIPGDIEVITHKALEKERSRRYRSAGDLADDIRRFLADEPITAKPPSLSEHIRRYARKHKAATIALSSIAAVVFLSVIAILYFAIEASRQRDIAQTEALAARTAESATAAALLRETAERKLAENRADRLRNVSLQLVGELHDEIKNLPGALEARERFLSMSEGQLEALLEENPDDRDAQLWLAVQHTSRGDLLGGTRTNNLGRPAEAMAAYDKAEIALRSLVAEDGENLEYALELARVLRRQGDLQRQANVEKALAQFIEAKRIAKVVLDRHPQNDEAIRHYSIALNSLSQAFLDMKRYEEASAQLEKSLELAQALSEAQPNDPALRHSVAMIQRRRAHIASSAGDDVQAETLHRDAMRLVEANVQMLPDDVRRLRHAAWQGAMLGEVLLKREKVEEGSQVLQLASGRAVKGCARDPGDAEQRKAVRLLIPGSCNLLIAADRRDVAIEIRRSALLVLQPVAEENPTNEALKEVLEVVRMVEVQIEPISQ